MPTDFNYPESPDIGKASEQFAKAAKGVDLVEGSAVLAELSKKPVFDASALTQPDNSKFIDELQRLDRVPEEFK